MSKPGIQISLAAARVNAKMTQNEVAKAIGVSGQTICNWENGKSEPTYKQARELSTLYGIDLDYIFLPQQSN